MAKKRSLFGRIASAILALVLLIVLSAGALAGYVFLNMKNMEVGTLDLPAAVAQEPLPAEERFVVDDGFGVRMTLGDLVLHLTEGLVEPEDLQQELEVGIRELGVDLTGFDVRLTADGIALDAATEFAGIRIAGTVLCSVKTEEGTMLVPEKIRIGALKIPVPMLAKFASRFGIDITELHYDLGGPLCSLVDTVERVEYEDGDLLIRGPWETRTLAALAPSAGAEQDEAKGCVVWYGDEYRALLDAASLTGKGRMEEAAELVLGAVRRGEMTMADVYELILGLEGRRNYVANYDLTGGDLDWAVPGLTADGAATRVSGMEKLCRERNDYMFSVFRSVYAAQRAGRIRVEKGRFLLDSVPFDVRAVAKDFEEQGFLTPQDVELCVNLLPAADFRGLKKLAAMSDGKESFSRNVFPELTYPLAVIVHTKDGGSVVYYRTYGMTAEYVRQERERVQIIPDRIYEECKKEGKATVLENW